MHRLEIGGKLAYQIDDIGFVDVKREKGYKNIFGASRPASLTCTVSGEMLYRLKDGTEIKGVPGTVLYRPAGIRHESIWNGENGHCLVLSFSFTGQDVPELFQKPILLVSPKAVDVFDGIRVPYANEPNYLAAKIYELLWLFGHEVNRPLEKYQKILPAVRRIETAYFENCPIAEYAALCRMSESNFRRLFREYTGQSPIEYRNLCRWNAAERLITSGECNVQEAAYLAGFNNMSFYYEVNRRFQKGEVDKYNMLL